MIVIEDIRMDAGIHLLQEVLVQMKREGTTAGKQAGILVQYHGCSEVCSVSRDSLLPVDRAI